MFLVPNRYFTIMFCVLSHYLLVTVRYLPDTLKVPFRYFEGTFLVISSDLCIHFCLLSLYFEGTFRLFFLLHFIHFLVTFQVISFFTFCVLSCYFTSTFHLLYQHCLCTLPSLSRFFRSTFLGLSCYQHF